MKCIYSYNLMEGYFMGETEQAMSGVDTAYRILKERKASAYFRDLLSEVLTAKMVPARLMMHAMAELHTQINLDSRFAFKGQGKWGLTEWAPLPRASGKSENSEGMVLEVEVLLRRAKLQDVQPPDEIEAGVQRESDEPA